MFAALLSTLRGQTGNDGISTRRRYTRHKNTKCVTLIGGKPYPVEDWSLGGVLVNADGRMFGVDNELDVTMKFKLRDEVMDIPQRARVVRKSHGKVAFEFMPLSNTARSNFQRVIDDVIASGFSGGQTV
ncbi:MAG: PilZ domain-containing protein [Alphaproteobacteria bacterium]|nr:PilZ domain-containing protein [Alphaproteobacteria bacterium]